jgi:hypothetical protein
MKRSRFPYFVVWALVFMGVLALPALEPNGTARMIISRILILVVIVMVIVGWVSFIKGYKQGAKHWDQPRGTTDDKQSPD